MTHRVLGALCFVAIFGCVDIAAAGAQNNEALGAVTGHVQCSDTQQPARLAHVVLQPVVDLNSPVLRKDDRGYHPEGTFQLQTVSLDGSFTIPAVPPGRYYVIAEQDGYITPLALFTRAQLNDPDEALKQKIARYMTTISVTAGHTTQADVTVIRGAVIAGMVRFEDGSPGINVGVQLLQRSDKGEWQTVRTGRLASHGMGGTSYTNDQGAYRFSGLAAGEYMVRANVELNKVTVSYIFASGGSTGYGDGYHLRVYPGDAFRPGDAKPVKVEEGEDATSVDVDIPLSKLYTLSGTVIQPNSELPVNSARLTLVFADTGEELTFTDVESDDGSFRFDFVPGGNYILRATNIANVERTDVPNCKGCIPPTHLELKGLATFGDASLPIQLTSDQSAVVVQATQSKKTATAPAQ
ncbi:MAG TPA: carboxypeptidase-like regulatory domain-containing protein [Acidobacteriaceae bacterium]|nr:carboxypeptidase-like regulatory domain-containing protein [Acidobacteriaceae bacterium]